ncbi:MAG: metallophosphoesterase [Prevotella sp.]|jgi:UDP-2,3-diacylglucosamine pyrophosphatase LpxH|nr:metallophosphoesterase [Prevotella sp.]
MKKSILFVCLFSVFGVWANEPIKIGVITDTHYLSEQLMDGGYALQDYIESSGKNVKDVPAVLDKVLEDYLNSDIEVLLVCGDMTKDGEKQSHLDFVQKLKPLQDKGVKIFVVPGNHDINMPNPVEYKGNKKFPVANISPDDFVDIYAECGYKGALLRDPASLSYVAELSGDTWLLTIDAARYKEYTTNSISSGKISPETEKWISGILDEAKAKNKHVVGMMHWGLTEHIMLQSMFFKNYLVDDWQRLANTFADKGMKAIFTGHFHSNDISAFTSDAGNTIYDIETGALVSYPFSYRFVDLYPDKMSIKTKNIVSIADNPSFLEEDKLRMQTLAKKQAQGKLKGLGFNMPPEASASFSEVMSQIFIMHAYGDEVMNETLRKSLAKLADTMDIPIDMEEVELDFPPADNNVEIVFE